MRYLLIFLFLFGCATTGTGTLEQRVADLEDEILMLQAGSVAAATKMYGRDCIYTTDCAKSLESINTTGWASNEYRAMILDENDRLVAIYYFDWDATDTVSTPSIVAPSTGSGRWFLHEGGVKGRIQFSISDPENTPTHAGRSAQSVLVWWNDTGVTFNIATIRAMSDTDDYTFDLYISNTKDDIGGANDSRVETSGMACSTNGTGGYYFLANSGFEDNTVANNQYLIFQHNSGSAEALHVYIEGYFY